MKIKVEDLKREINSWISGYFKSTGNYEKILYQSMNYSLNNSGKRIRPILNLLTYNLYKEDIYTILPFACSIEMIHTYSLIHDDLPCMDDDDFRRGRPTNHKVFGFPVALLAGDALLNEAAKIMLQFSLERGEEAIHGSIVVLNSSGAEGMVAGQVVDIMSEGREIPFEELQFMHKCKTGALIKSAIVSGAVLGCAPLEEVHILDEFGEKLGLAFQIKDDILDVIGDSKLMGKSINSDIVNHKTTFVSQFGVEKCTNMCNELTDNCIELLNSLKGRNTSELKNITEFLLKRDF